jgi:hypothetical protein
MGKIKKGNYIFISWIGDHGHHVHVFKDNCLVVKWDVDNWKPMKGSATKRIEDLLRELLKEGKL